MSCGLELQPFCIFPKGGDNFSPANITCAKNTCSWRFHQLSHTKIIELSQSLWQILDYFFWKRSCCLKINCKIEGLSLWVWWGIPSIYPPKITLPAGQVSDSLALSMVAIATSQLAVHPPETACPSMKGSGLIDADTHSQTNLLCRKLASFSHCSARGAMLVVMFGLGSRRRVHKVKKGSDFHGKFTTDGNSASTWDQGSAVPCSAPTPAHTHWNLQPALQSSTP